MYHFSICRNRSKWDSNVTNKPSEAFGPTQLNPSAPAWVGSNLSVGNSVALQTALANVNDK